jgi:hypothetical protein
MARLTSVGPGKTWQTVKISWNSREVSALRSRTSTRSYIGVMAPIPNVREPTLALKRSQSRGVTRRTVAHHVL